MIRALPLATALILALAAPVAVQAATPPARDPAPGLEVDNACMAWALVEAGFQGAIRVATPAAHDRSLQACDLEAELSLVPDYRVAAGPCMAQALRDQGYLGRVREPRGGLAQADLACVRPSAATAPVQDLATFRRSDGLEITTMRPIPNPD